MFDLDKTIDNKGKPHIVENPIPEQIPPLPSHPEPIGNLNINNNANRRTCSQDNARPLITFTVPSQYRISKREHGDCDGPEAKRYNKEPGSLLPNTSMIGDSFREYNKMAVQLNSWELDISGMDETISKILFKVTLVLPDGKGIELNQGFSAVSGDLNRQARRIAQCLLFKKWFERASENVFNGRTNPSIVAFDAAETIYVANSNFSGGLKEHVYTLCEEDFGRSDWEIISKLSRKKGAVFKICIKHIGEIVTKGPMALAEANRPELIRCLETVTNQVLHTNEFLLYQSGTYPINDVVSYPDDTTEIKSGFSKVTNIIEGQNGCPKAIVTIDTASSAFFKSIPLVKFVYAKMNIVNNHGRGGPGFRGRRGGFRGRSYGCDGNQREDRRDSYKDRDQRNDNSDNPYTDYDANLIRGLNENFKNESVETFVFDNLKKSIRGLECIPIHLKNNGSNNSIIIDEVVKGNAQNTFFKRQTEEGSSDISVEKYYVETYNYRLKFPNLPLISSKRRKCIHYYPMELLFIAPGQRVTGSHMTSEIQTHMTGRNSVLPLQHVNQQAKIMEQFLKLGKRGRNEFLEGFNIQFNNHQPITVMAKVLSPPSIRFASGPLYAPDPSRGVSFKTHFKFVKPAIIKNVTIICYDSGFNDMKEFCRSFVRYAAEQGIQFHIPIDKWRIVELNPKDDFGTKQELQKARENDATVVIGIAYEKRPEVHDVMKYYEEKLGQLTIQITTDTARKFCNGHGGKQTIENVIRKFNPKCGRTNFYVRLPEKVAGRAACTDILALEEKLYLNTQFIGFEMSHEGARTKYNKQMNTFEGEPTCVGVAYSLKQSAELGGFSYYQDTRFHKLTRLQEKFSCCIEAYQEATQSLPKTITIFRVGSGEGDYKQVVAEVEEMKMAAVEKFMGYSPKFVVIMAQRHSHVRIFPKDIRGVRAVEQNVPSGTCVDCVASAHKLDEFILCCQTPLIGTVRPTRYTVIVNEANWSKNEVMNVTYHLAFGHQVSYTPPAVPNVLYAAKNLAKRAHNNYKVHINLASRRDMANRIKQQYNDVSQDIIDEALLVNELIDGMSDDINRLTISGRNFWA